MRNYFFPSSAFSLTTASIVDDILRAVPDTLPPIETTSHLHPLDLRPQLNFFFGPKKYVGEATDDPRILFANRARLRAWLATDIDIGYDKKVVSIKEGDSKVTVRFADGSLATGDVLVGADGSGSFGQSVSYRMDSC